MEIPLNLLDLARLCNVESKQLFLYLKKNGIYFSDIHIDFDSTGQYSRITETLLDFFYRAYTEIEPGEIVLHNTYGRGEVIRIDDESLRKIAVINFDSSGTKKMLLSVAKFFRPLLNNSEILYDNEEVIQFERIKRKGPSFSELIKSFVKPIGINSKSYFLRAPNNYSRVVLLECVQKYFHNECILLVSNKQMASLTGLQTVSGFFHLPEDGYVEYERLELIAEYLYSNCLEIIEKEKIVICGVNELNHYTLEGIAYILRKIKKIQLSKVNAYAYGSLGPRESFFGTKSLLFIGEFRDFRLAQNNSLIEEKESYFNSFSFRNTRLNFVEISSFETNQNDRNEEFSVVLGKIKEGKAKQDDLDFINQKFSLFPLNNESVVICSSGLNNSVLNNLSLEGLTGKEEVFIAEIEGDLSPENFPKDVELRLKTGAKVFFVCNDKEGRFSFGTRGVVVFCDSCNKLIKVRIDGDKVIDIGYHTWFIPQLIHSNSSLFLQKVLFRHLPVVLDYAHDLLDVQNLKNTHVFLNLGNEALQVGELYSMLSCVSDFNGLTISRHITFDDLRLDIASYENFKSIEFKEIAFDLDGLKSRFEVYYEHFVKGLSISEMSDFFAVSEDFIAQVFLNNYFNLSDAERDVLFGGVDESLENLVLSEFKSLSLCPIDKDFLDSFSKYGIKNFQILHIGYKHNIIYHPDSKEYALFNSEKKKYQDYFKLNRDFGILYISMYYPFEYEYLIENWNSLEIGKAFYSDYRDEYVRNEYYSGPELEFFQSELGLSFNKNIRWNSKLRAKYDCGFIREVEGQIILEGVNAPESVVNWELSHKLFSIQDREYLDEMIPLSIEVEFLNSRLILEEFQARVQQWNDLDYNDYFRLHYDYRFSFFNENLDIPPREKLTEILHTPYPRLSFSVFKYMIETAPLTILANSSIYENTIKNYLDFDFVDEFVRNAESTDYNDLDYF